jgi:hypothetical protein
MKNVLMSSNQANFDAPLPKEYPDKLELFRNNL